MFTIRQILVRMRQGDRDREIARSGLMGRKKLGALRNHAAQHGWLDPQQPLPDNRDLAILQQHRPSGKIIVAQHRRMVAWIPWFSRLSVVHV